MQHKGKASIHSLHTWGDMKP